MKFPFLLTDFYKLNHAEQYPQGTTEIYSNFTPRSVKYFPIGDQIVVFGTKYLIEEYIKNGWENNFLAKEWGYIESVVRSHINNSISGIDDFLLRLKSLHDLGYLPIKIKALPENSIVNEKTPILTIRNTHKDFYWLTNFMETAISSFLWKPCTTATIAKYLHDLAYKYAHRTGDTDFVPYQFHDFSLRGLSGESDAILSGIGHLTKFKGTDNVLASHVYGELYGDNKSSSVYATEHSVMCAGGKDSEFHTYKRLINDVYPSGILSIVSDTWNYWKVLTEILPKLKNDILKRDGKIVIRPDSGEAIKIICGDAHSHNEYEKQGSLNLLWKYFGGTINDKGYKELNEKIGLIYGDSITFDTAQSIFKRMEEMGFATTNIVLGVGSFTYEYLTRDTLGFAMKATSCVINGCRKSLFKDPITDSGLKKSHKGLLCVKKSNGKYRVVEECNPIQEDGGELQVIYEN